MIPRYRALAKRIELELAVLDNTQQVARRHWQRSLIQETDRAFNEQVGTNCSDVNRVSRRILEAIVLQVAADNAFQNAARRSDRQNARIEQSVGPRDAGAAQRRHRIIQAVQRQCIGPPMVGGYGLWDGVWGR